MHTLFHIFKVITLVSPNKFNNFENMVQNTKCKCKHTITLDVYYGSHFALLNKFR